MLETITREFSLFSHVFGSILTAPNILMMIFGTLGGIVIGAIPGLTATMALALLITNFP